MLGLPPYVTACLFDLDGVLTDTAAVHSVAWHEAFTRFLDQLPEPAGVGATRPFTYDDYLSHVDGKPRPDGTRDFLASRGIGLPEGDPDEAPGFSTVHGLANFKNVLLLRRLDRVPAEVFPGSRRYLEAVRAAGLPRAVVSASANAGDVLRATGLASLVRTRVDGHTLRRLGLRGKPAPDSFLEGARRLGVEPARAAVFEDATVGVAAARAGGFGYVVGVDRSGRPDDLLAHGADVVVQDLSQLLPEEDR